MKLSKADREQVRLKYDGRCAYCGHPLPERWHADHFIAVKRHAWGKRRGEMRKPEHHHLDNMMPSCPTCNISKGKLSLEAWRKWLAGHLKSLNDNHSIYRLAKSYGLVVETGRPVVFHFESVTQEGAK